MADPGVVANGANGTSVVTPAVSSSTPPEGAFCCFRQHNIEVKAETPSTDGRTVLKKVQGIAKEIVDNAEKFEQLAAGRDKDPFGVASKDQADLLGHIRDRVNIVSTLVSLPEVQNVDKGSTLVSSPKVAEEVHAAAKKLQESAGGSAPEQLQAAAAGIGKAVVEIRSALDKLPAAEDIDKQVSSYTILANLLKINNYYPLHKLALEEWDRKKNDLFTKVTRREAKNAELTNQIYNIIGWFAVFHGMVLTAVTQTTSTSNDLSVCRKIWYPIVLTSFASLVTIGRIIIKFRSLKSFERTIHREKQDQNHLEESINTLIRNGPERFRFSEDAGDIKSRREPKLSWWGCYWVILILLTFTGIFILSYLVILCDDFLSPKKRS